MHLIVPVDFSPNSIKALELALTLNQNEKTKITLVHIIEAVYDFASQAAVALDSMHKDSEKMIKKIILQHADSGVEFDHRIEEGTASISIARLAEDLNASMIVMGTRGASGLKKTFFGSTTVNLLKETNCPVLIVPESVNTEQIHRITLALEFSNHEPSSIDRVINLSKKWNLMMEFLHVETAKGFKEELACLGLEKFVQNKFPELPMRFYTYYGETASDGLNSFVEEHDHMILSLCHQHRNLTEALFKKSQSYELAYHSKVPLLILQ